MDVGEQKAKAMGLRGMHRGPKILLLPNAWDVVSARVLEDAGFGAIATTSAGIAFTLGYPDGEKISRAEMLARVGRVARAVKVAVSADVEAGYGPRPEDAARTAREADPTAVPDHQVREARPVVARHELHQVSLDLHRIVLLREAETL